MRVYKKLNYSIWEDLLFLKIQLKLKLKLYTIQLKAHEKIKSTIYFSTKWVIQQFLFSFIIIKNCDYTKIFFRH